VPAPTLAHASKNMNIHTNKAALPLQQPEQPAKHRRTHSRNTSISSSSVVTVKRAASLSLRDSTANPEPPKPHTTERATPPPSTARRRSSAANGAADGGIGSFRDGAANINRWSQSTTSSRSSQPREREKGHQQHPSFSRKLSISSAGQLSAQNLHGATAHPASPSRLNNNSSRSPASSPRRNRPRSPVYEPSPSTAAPPQIPSLPPILLPSSVYDPNTPTSASTNNSPSTSGLFTPSILASGPPRDYFNSKPLAPPASSQRPPSRSKVERVLGKSPLGSPAIIGVREGDARHDRASGTARSSSSRRPSVPSTRDSAQRPPQSAGHRQAASRDHSRNTSRDHHRSGTRDHSRSTSKDHHRSESNTSAITEENYQGTPPRSREKREKDKKTMLSRALQKANTAVLLDNAQNFEGAMEAYEDACKLLQQVMIRSSQEEDRRKLDAIVS
jgi:hypothetical protein